MGIRGLDVSNVNGPIIHLPAYSPSFVIAKASEGTTFTDFTFSTYAVQANAMKIHFGAYHFFHAENENARAQADHFMTCCKPASGMSLWLDYETYGKDGQTDAEEIGYFIDEVKVHFPHAKVGIYANMTGIDRILPYLAEIPFQGFWFAQPGTADIAPSPLPPVQWQIHQFGETASGIDLDYWDWTIQKIDSYYTWPAT